MFNKVSSNSLVPSLLPTPNTDKLFIRLQLLALSSYLHLGKEFPPRLEWLSDKVESSGYPSSVIITLKSQCFQGELEVISERNYEIRERSLLLQSKQALLSQNSAYRQFVFCTLNSGKSTWLTDVKSFTWQDKKDPRDTCSEHAFHSVIHLCNNV